MWSIEVFRRNRFCELYPKSIPEEYSVDFTKTFDQLQATDAVAVLFPLYLKFLVDEAAREREFAEAQLMQRNAALELAQKQLHLMRCENEVEQAVTYLREKQVTRSERNAALDQRESALVKDAVEQPSWWRAAVVVESEHCSRTAVSKTKKSANEGDLSWCTASVRSWCPAPDTESEDSSWATVSEPKPATDKDDLSWCTASVRSWS